MEFVHLIDVWAGLIFLVVLTIASLVLAENDLDVGVRGAVVVTSCQVKGTDDIAAYIALALLHEKSLDDLIRLNVYDLPEDLQMTESHLAHELLEEGASLWVQDSAGTIIEVERSFRGACEQRHLLSEVFGSPISFWILDIITVGAFTLRSCHDL